MEAKFLKDPDNKCDYVLVSADEQSFTYLNQGNPLRVGFFIDNNENLPWHKRKAMVVIIGRDLDFERNKVYKEGFFKKGLVDKSYLVDYIQKMKKKLIQMAMQELDVLDIPGEPMTTNLMIENMAEPMEEIIEPKNYISTDEASEMLNVSYCTITNLVKRGMIKGEHNGNGRCFIRADIEKLLQEKPEFLKKIWNDGRSITKKEPYSKELIRGQEKYIHIRRAQALLKLSENTINKYAEAGLIRAYKQDHEKYYISTSHIEELTTNPPDWLKKSWSYFNNNKAE